MATDALDSYGESMGIILSSPFQLPYCGVVQYHGSERKVRLLVSSRVLTSDIMAHNRLIAHDVSHN